MNERLVFTVAIDHADSRLDKFLAQQAPICSRSRAEYLIDAGLVTVNRKPVKASYKLKENDFIEVKWPKPTSSSLLPLDLPLDIVYEDSDLLVVNKPAGLVVHPAAGHANDTLVNALLAHTKNLSMKFGEDRPGIVHRIDKETSGLLVVAKNDHTHQNLSDQFKQRTIQRLYQAICTGVPLIKENKITSIIARHPTDRKRFASLRDHKGHTLASTDIVPEIGKIAITDYKVLKSKTTASLIELKLHTGRTHQIRVHMSELGHPLLGDKLYSTSSSARKISGEMKQELEQLNRFLLHAKVLGFTHPVTQKPLHFEVDWPMEEKKFISKWFS
ncbi:MAG: RluA family pseudouridine synthase [Bdellovibrionaceae bacterium]|nr:RluA family pseudouridine synthase [Pseudobdellovibrionaceae bacterium]